MFRQKGWLMKNGYRARFVDGKQVYEHRYLMEQHLRRKLGKDECIDHINGNKSDNRLENLRVCTKRQNEHYYHGITEEDYTVIRERLKAGSTYRAAIRETNVKSPAVAYFLAKREGIR